MKDLAVVVTPAAGMRLDLRADAAGMVRIDEVLLHPRGDAIGFIDPAVTAVLEREPAGSAEAARAHGWREQAPATAAEPG